MAAGAGVLPLSASGPVRIASHAEYLTDTGHDLRIAQIVTPGMISRFQPVSQRGDINFGYTRDVVWLRVPVNSPGAGEWMLEIEYPTLDQVALFAPDGQGGWQRQLAGDLQPYSQRPYPYHNLVFPLQLPAGESVLYLRVQSAGSMTVPARIWPARSFHLHATDNNALHALYFGSLLALGLYNLLLYFSIRDRAYVEYFGFVLGMLVAQASQIGFANQYLWPDWPYFGHLAFPGGFALTGLFGAMFTRTFLQTARIMPRLDQAILGFIGLLVLCALVLPVSYAFGSKLVSLTGLGFSCLALVGGVLSLRRGHGGAGYFLLAWSLLLAGVVIQAMRNFGWLPTNVFTANAVLLGSSLEMLLLSFALADRINSVRRDKDMAQAEALQAKQAMVEALHRSERELESKVEVRTRELEAANARLLRRESELANLARRDPLTGLANRGALDEEMDRALHRADRDGQHVGLLLIDLDRFKPINDTLGHEAGDQVLIEVARRLRESTRINDLVFRLGGDEFVVLLECEDVEMSAGQVAVKLLKNLRKPIDYAGHRLEVGASIGVARCPTDGKNLRDLLHRADIAMYQAKAIGGGGYRLSNPLN